MRNSIKSIFKILGVVMAATFVLAACSKDDDPADNDLFVGTYKGDVSYTMEGKNIHNDSGEVRVVKVGSNYNFFFSDKIPDITGVQFEKKGDNGIINVGSDEARLISIDNKKLVIAYAKDGRVWTANANR